MRTVILGAFLLLSLILESTVLEHFQVAGVKPDLILILVVFNALLHGCYHGAKLGFVFGLVEDFFIGKFIGLNALTRMLTGYLVGLVENKLFKENLLVPVFGLFTATFINNILYVFLAGLAGVERNLAFYVWDVTLPTALYNACLAPLFYGKFYHSATKGYLRLSRY